jgi:uncharacterized protein YjbJ (UPF0337 family)
MSNHEQTTRDLPDNLDEAKGRAKQAIGDLTNDESLKREGEADEAAGGIKDKIDGAADKIKETIDDVRNRIPN